MGGPGGVEAVWACEVLPKSDFAKISSLKSDSLGCQSQAVGIRYNVIFVVSSICKTFFINNFFSDVFVPGCG